jgi:uncharacterized protein
MEVLNQVLPIDPEMLALVCRRQRVGRLSLFGSRLKGTARADSDVDLLVEFEAGATPILLDMARIEQQLAALMGGRTVDLRTARELSRYFLDVVIREARVQYVAG